MNTYSISDLQQLSGIKAHTIRIWEQRYQALKPQRSEGNTRYYDNNQLRRLLNIVSLNEAGYKLQEICSLSDKKLSELLDEKFIKNTVQEAPQEYFISELILAGLNFDEIAFEKHFSTCILKYGLRDSYLNIIYPLLNRVGLMWGKNSISPAQEHFMSCLIRQKLNSAIDSLAPTTNNDERWILFLPSFESHEIGLIFAHYLLKINGKKVIYLGANVPYESLKSAFKTIQPTHLLYFMVHSLPTETAQNYADSIRKISGKAINYISGNQKVIQSFELPKNTIHINDIETFEKIIQ